MAPSQLKQLKASLHAGGITRPQTSKKQKKRRDAGNRSSDRDRALQKEQALRRIREQFNPFEVKDLSRRRDKFDVTVPVGKERQGAKVRPGVSKTRGEEARRHTLLRDLQRRNKIGGVKDRRFGEDDPSMPLEQKMTERFTRENQRRVQNDSIFNLEGEETADQLTHLGQSLSFDDSLGLGVDERDDSESDDGLRAYKRRRLMTENAGQIDTVPDNVPERPKSKAEVMSEVIAKSKKHKYERQKAQEEDDDVREELDKELPDLLGLMRGTNSSTGTKAPQTNGAFTRQDRANGENLDVVNRNYDQRLRQMALDKRSMPTERTKTEEEKAEEEADRLRDLENKRVRRMQGQDDESQQSDSEAPELEVSERDRPDQDSFGLGGGIPISSKPPDVEDEDEFMIDEDLVNTGSVSLGSDDEVPSGESSIENEDDESDEDDDLVKGLLSVKDADRPEFAANSVPPKVGIQKDLAFVYSCPESHEDFLRMVKDVPFENHSTIVQRIRALYHPKLKAENKPKLEKFAGVLVTHIVYLGSGASRTPFAVLEALIRHLHSLAKTYPIEVSRSVRSHLKDFQDQRPLAPNDGDLILFVAIGSMYSTSDHFHSVVTPANLSMARYLSQSPPKSVHDLVKGSWMQTLYLHYQRISKRYAPELVCYTFSAMQALTFSSETPSRGSMPGLGASRDLQIQDAPANLGRKLHLWRDLDTTSQAGFETVKLALLDLQFDLCLSMTTMWAEKPAFYEAFVELSGLVSKIVKEWRFISAAPAFKAKAKETRDTMKGLLSGARQVRRPLELHHHRPLPIKSSIPKFEESFDPSKHYDPNRDRAEMSKLKAEHKRERKGAMRELRKDANFIARESLKEKKERDAEYEKKYRRLVSEIQGSEGREANQYEKERRMRKKK